MTNENIEKRSRKLAHLLRHDKDYDFDNGFRCVSDLVKNHNYTMELLEVLVVTDAKNRYSFSPDKTKIRANYGHSKWIKIDWEEGTPPDVLYHGTAEGAVESIMQTGIESRSRTFVHLSVGEEMAVTVGARHKKNGKPCILVVNAKQMHEDGIKFYLSGCSSVWLTDYVAPKYIEQVVRCS